MALVALPQSNPIYTTGMEFEVIAQCHTTNARVCRMKLARKSLQFLGNRRQANPL